MTGCVRRRYNVLLNDKNPSDAACTLECVPVSDADKPLHFEYRKHSTRAENEEVLRSWVLALSPAPKREEPKKRGSLEVLPSPIKLINES
jgi:hypothetical protein